MAKQTILNNDSGIVARTKLNDNFTETYDTAGIKVSKSGDTMTGALILNTNNPSLPLQAASKQYVDVTAAAFAGTVDTFACIACPKRRPVAPVARCWRHQLPECRHEPRCPCSC